MSSLRALGSAVLVSLVSALLLVSSAGPALAHFGGGRQPSNYQGEITGINPPMPGVTVTLIDNADRVEIRNESATPVIVYGYQHDAPGDRDQYLKISSDGVWVNTESQAHYLNQSLMGSSHLIPERLKTDTGEGEPVWEKVSDEGVYRWHDHRTHWMSLQPPPAVQAEPDRVHVINKEEWRIFAKLGDEPESTITGLLRWIPANPAPWWTVLVGAAVIGAAGAFTRSWATLLAGAAGLLALLELGHVAVTAYPIDDYHGSFWFALFAATVPALGVAGLSLLAMRALRAGRMSGRFLLGGAGALAAVQGSSDLNVIWNSQLEQAGPAWLARLIIASVIGLGVGLVIAAGVLSLRTDEQEGREPTADIASDEEMDEVFADASILGRRTSRKRPVPDAATGDDTG